MDSPYDNGALIGLNWSWNIIAQWRKYVTIPDTLTLCVDKQRRHDINHITHRFTVNTKFMHVEHVCAITSWNILIFVYTI